MTTGDARTLPAFWGEHVEPCKRKLHAIIAHSILSRCSGQPVVTYGKQLVAFGYQPDYADSSSTGTAPHYRISRLYTPSSPFHFSYLSLISTVVKPLESYRKFNVNWKLADQLSITYHPTNSKSRFLFLYFYKAMLMPEYKYTTIY